MIRRRTGQKRQGFITRGELYMKGSLAGIEELLCDSCRQWHKRAVADDAGFDLHSTGNGAENFAFRLDIPFGVDGEYRHYLAVAVLQSKSHFAVVLVVDDERGFVALP